MNGYRLMIKMNKRWHTGLVSYGTPEAANTRVDELVALGQKRNNIKVKAEQEIFC